MNTRPSTATTRSGPGCAVVDCPCPVLARGWCARHYRRWRRHGDPAIVRPREDRAVLFWAKVDCHGPVPDGAAELGPCWLWTAARRSGYGAFHVPTTGIRTRPVPAHRWAYEHHHGPLPAQLTVEHLCHLAEALTVGCGGGPTCDHRGCVNPAHLVLVPAGARLRSVAPAFAGTLRCPRGHRYDLVDRHGQRRCGTCGQQHAAALLPGLLDGPGACDVRQRAVLERLAALTEPVPEPRSTELYEPEPDQAITPTPTESHPA